MWAKSSDPTYQKKEGTSPGRGEGFAKGQRGIFFQQPILFCRGRSVAGGKDEPVWTSLLLEHIYRITTLGVGGKNIWGGVVDHRKKVIYQ